MGVVCAPGEDPLKPKVRLMYDSDGFEDASGREVDTRNPT